MFWRPKWTIEKKISRSRFKKRKIVFKSLNVTSFVVYLISSEESTLWERIGTSFTLEAVAVEVDVVDSKDLAGTLLPATLAISFTEKFEWGFERSEGQVLFLLVRARSATILDLRSLDRIRWLHCHHFIWRIWSREKLMWFFFCGKTPEIKRGEC